MTLSLFFIYFIGFPAIVVLSILAFAGLIVMLAEADGRMFWPVVVIYLLDVLAIGFVLEGLGILKVTA